MERIPADEEREQRLHMEIIGDAYGPEEQAIGWYSYLEEVMPATIRRMMSRSDSQTTTKPFTSGI